MTNYDAGAYIVLEFWDCRIEPSLAPVEKKVDTNDATTVNAKMQPGGFVSGTVRGNDGNPLANVCVDIFDGRGLYGGTPGIVLPIYATRTDPQGNFRFGGLAPVTHWVLFGDCIGENETFTFKPMWFGDTHQYSNADCDHLDPVRVDPGGFPGYRGPPTSEIKIESGATTTGIDATLERDASAPSCG
jgi:hypothetical protein